MPEQNVFRHQDYWSVPSKGTYEQIGLPTLVAPGSREFSTGMEFAKSAMERADVRRVILVHGTLAGTDALGWYGHWQRFLPGVSSKLKTTYKSVVDRLTCDRGNYPQAYADLLCDALNSESDSPRINVERFTWSSENHHLGRADAAVRLADRLLDYQADGERVLLMGHSHAGNVFALVTWLLGEGISANPALATRFFDASRHFSPATQRIALATWRRLETRLGDLIGREFKTSKLDIATFGTPVRYGWDSTAFENLLHFVNHHPVDGIEPFRGVWPGSTSQFSDALKGEYGDFVQQTCVARSDITPVIWSWNAWKANRMLRNLLEATELPNKRLERLKQAPRVADQGTTLLVDYGAVDPSAKDVCGHVVYTDTDWMVFHMNEITSRFYSC